MLTRRVFSIFLSILFPILTCAQELNDELWAAARKGDAATVKALLAKGADVNAKLRYGTTALSYAADRGHLDVVKVLVEHGAELNIKDTFYNSPPLSWAAYNGHTEVVKFLLEKGAEGKETALMSGIQDGNLEMINAALAVGGFSAETLTSALSTATQGNKTEIIETLKKAGATPATLPDFKIDPAVLQMYAGLYKNADIAMEMTFKVENGKLIGSIPGQPALTYAPVDNNNFKAVEFSGIAITFNVTNNQVADFTLKQGERSFIFKRATVEAGAANTASAASDQKETTPVAAIPAKTKRDRVTTSKHWPSFRGPFASGVADGQNPPATWDVEKAQNVKWKTPIPGMSHASPVIWGDRVFITTAVTSDTSSKLRVGLYGDVAPDKDVSKHIWKVYCLDKKNGKIIWERTAFEGVPKVKRHTKATQANSTPATDGKHLVVLFGAEGLYCYDFSGKLVWKKDLGMLDSGWFYDPDYQWGHGSSPIIYKNLVIVQCDIQKNSFIAAYDLKDGKSVWQTQRDEIPSWGTPTIHEGKSRVELIANGTKYIRGYDPLTGKELWKLAGNSEITTPTPFVAHDLIYVTSGYRPIQPIYAIRLGATGDISLADKAESNAHIAWSKQRGGPYMPTPIVYGDYLYVCANNGAVTCYNAKTGEQIYRNRLGGQGSGYAFTASPIAADDKIYFTSEDGEIFVVKAGPQYELLATNSMHEVCMATPAISEGMILVRTQQHVYGIGE